MASIAAFVYFWSSAYEVSGGCATDTLYPSFLRILATAFQPEPSAKAPCTRTTFLIAIVVLLFFFSVPFTCISSCKPTSFVRDKARYSGSGWSFGRFLSCNIHSLIYGEQCRIETPADSHMLRKRTASTSTRSTSPRSKATRGPPRPTSAFTWPTFSDRSCPLKQMRVSRFLAIRLIFSVMDLCSEERSKECNHQAIRDSLQGWKLQWCAVLNFQEFLPNEESTIGIMGPRSESVSLRGFESILVYFQTLDLRVESPCRQAQFSC